MSSQHIPAVGSHVVISGGKKLGSVTRLVETGGEGTVTGFEVHYGWRHRKTKIVPTGAVKWVNDGSVILNLSRKQFDELADASPAQATPRRDIDTTPDPATASGHASS